MNILYVFCFYFITRSTSHIAVYDKRLIYSQDNWDEQVNRFRYCQFTTREHIDRNEVAIEGNCFNKYRDMQHILKDGTITVPFAQHGSENSFILQCDELPQVKLLNCSRFVHSLCNFTCKYASGNASLAVHEMRCDLVGPNKNVQAQWSDRQICSELTKAPNVTDPVQEAGWKNKNGIIIGAVLAAIISVILFVSALWWHKRHQSEASKPGVETVKLEMQEQPTELTKPNLAGVSAQTTKLLPEEGIAERQFIHSTLECKHHQSSVDIDADAILKALGSTLNLESLENDELQVDGT